MKKVLLLLASGFEVYEAAVFTDVFGFAETGGIPVKLDSCGLQKVVKCAYGFDVIPNFVLSDCDLTQYDALAIPGGRRDSGYYQDSESKEFQEIIKHFLENDKLIATVCVAAIPVAQTGLVSARKMTTYPGKKQTLLQDLGVKVINKPIVQDKNLTSCSSPAQGLEVSFKLLEKLTSKSESSNVREWFGFEI